VAQQQCFGRCSSSTTQLAWYVNVCARVYVCAQAHTHRRTRVREGCSAKGICRAQRALNTSMSIVSCWPSKPPMATNEEGPLSQHAQSRTALSWPCGSRRVSSTTALQPTRVLRSSAHNSRRAGGRVGGACVGVQLSGHAAACHHMTIVWLQGHHGCRTAAKVLCAQQQAGR